MFELSAQQASWNKRALFMGILLWVPVLLTLLFRAEGSFFHVEADVTGFDLFGVILVFYYLGNAIPLEAFFYAGSWVADELEGKTLTYLLTRPISRASILVGKFTAFLAIAISFTLPPVVLSYLLLVTGEGGRGLAATAPDLFRDMGVCVLALLSYGAVFTLLGCFLKRPLLPGLLYLFVWETVASHLPGYLPRFTLSAYLRSLVTHRPPDENLIGLFGQSFPAGESLIALAVASLAGLVLSSWIFSRKEYVMEA